MRNNRLTVISIHVILLALYSHATFAGGDKDELYANGMAEYKHQNFQAAYYVLIDAATMGHQQAAFELAMMHNQGIGVPRNVKMAYAWMQVYAHYGNAIGTIFAEKIYEGADPKIRIAAKQEAENLMSVVHNNVTVK